MESATEWQLTQRKLQSLSQVDAAPFFPYLFNYTFSYIIKFQEKNLNLNRDLNLDLQISTLPGALPLSYPGSPASPPSNSPLEITTTLQGDMIHDTNCHLFITKRTNFAF